MRRYFGRKLLIYGLTFFVAVTINWMIPRFMPGDPVPSMLARARRCPSPDAVEAMRAHYTNLFGLDLPLWQQYLNFWAALFQGDLGISVWLFPTPGDRRHHRARAVHAGAADPVDPAQLVGGQQVRRVRGAAQVAGQHGAAGGVRAHRHARTCGSAILLAWGLGIVAGIFPVAGGYSFAMRPNWSLEFLGSLAQHWFLPFASLFLVAFGGWAIGMRNMIIYELEADYSNYLAALGAPQRLDPAVRVPQRAAAAAHRPGAAARRARGRRAGHRDRLRLSGPGPPDPARRSRTRTSSCCRARSCSSCRRAGRQLRHRHRLRPGRPAHADRDGRGARHDRRPAYATPRRRARRSPEALYFALRNGKLLVGAGRAGPRCSSSAVVGPLLAGGDPNEYVGTARRAALGRALVRHHHVRPGRLPPVRPRPARRPSWSALLGGGLAAVIGMAIGFVAGYRGGLVDEVLNMLTNIVLVLPALAVLLILTPTSASAASACRRCSSGSPPGRGWPGRSGRRRSRCAPATSSTWPG